MAMPRIKKKKNFWLVLLEAFINTNHNKQRFNIIETRSMILIAMASIKKENREESDVSSLLYIDIYSIRLQN